MSPFELRELLVEIKNQFPEINKTFGVVDDSMLANKTSILKKEDNIILVGVLPNYSTSGKNSDNYVETPVTQLLFLEKSDYSDMTDDQFWELFQRTYTIMKKVKNWLIEKIEDGCFESIRFLDLNSLDGSAVWKKAECNGYSLDIE